MSLFYTPQLRAALESVGKRVPVQDRLEKEYRSEWQKREYRFIELTFEIFNLHQFADALDGVEGYDWCLSVRACPKHDYVIVIIKHRTLMEVLLVQYCAMAFIVAVVTSSLLESEP